MNIILGSGVIGLMAKHMLGDNWTVIPFNRSRFYSFTPALCDDYIIRNEELDTNIADIIGYKPNLIAHQKAWSINGELTKKPDKTLAEAWLYKAIGPNIPEQYKLYYDQMMTFKYDLKITHLYDRLMSTYIKDLKAESAKGNVEEIHDHYIIRNGKRTDFDKCISTIPLNKTLDLIGYKHTLKSLNMHVTYLTSNTINLEGADDALVVDKLLSFYKVSKICNNEYILYWHEDVENIGPYLMNIIPNFDLLSGTTVPDAIILGTPQGLDILEKYGIFSVGCYAEWDWCMDVGSCILKLLRYCNNIKRMTIIE